MKTWELRTHRFTAPTGAQGVAVQLAHDGPTQGLLIDLLKEQGFKVHAFDGNVIRFAPETRNGADWGWRSISVERPEEKKTTSIMSGQWVIIHDGKTVNVLNQDFATHYFGCPEGDQP